MVSPPVRNFEIDKLLAEKQDARRASRTTGSEMRHGQLTLEIEFLKLVRRLHWTQRVGVSREFKQPLV